MHAINGSFIMKQVKQVKQLKLSGRKRFVMFACVSLGNVNVESRKCHRTACCFDIKRHEFRWKMFNKALLQLEYATKRLLMTICNF